MMPSICSTICRSYESDRHSNFNTRTTLNKKVLGYRHTGEKFIICTVIGFEVVDFFFLVSFKFVLCLRAIKHNFLEGTRAAIVSTANEDPHLLLARLSRRRWYRLNSIIIIIIIIVVEVHVLLLFSRVRSDAVLHTLIHQLHCAQPALITIIRICT